jgi:hypothetical protein
MALNQRGGAELKTIKAFIQKTRIFREAKLFLVKTAFACIHMWAYVGTGYLKSPYMVIYVPMDKLNGALNIKSYKDMNKRYHRLFFISLRKAGRIENGTWDTNRRSFDDMTVFKSFEQRYKLGCKWEETAYYTNFMRKNKEQQKMRSCMTWEEFYKKHLARWDQLYQDMALNGYSSQRELGGLAINEIEVAVSREGEILFVDGRHRLAMAKILGIEKIPVIVNLWHQDYIDRVRTLYGKSSLTPREAIQPILDVSRPTN